MICPKSQSWGLNLAGRNHSPKRGDRYRLASYTHPPPLGSHLRERATVLPQPTRPPRICPPPPPTHPLTPATGAPRCPLEIPDTRPPQGLCAGCLGGWNSPPTRLAPLPPSGLCSNATFPARAPPNIRERTRNPQGQREGAASAAGGKPGEPLSRGPSDAGLAAEPGLRTSYRI